jgi:MoaD family protein
MRDRVKSVPKCRVDHMRVRVRFYGLVHDEVGSREREFKVDEGSTVRALMDRIIVDYPKVREMVYDDGGGFRDFLEIAVNQVAMIDLNRVLKDGDQVQIMPPIGGG